MPGIYDAVVGQFSSVSRNGPKLRQLRDVFIIPCRFCKPSEENKRQKQVAQILEKLILLTIEEVEMYPSIQAKIWGSIGQVPELIDMVLDNFIHRSVSSGLGSPMVEIMADTAVALASANVQLVAKKVIGRLCRVINYYYVLYYCKVATRRRRVS